MIKITLPDGSVKEFASGTTPMDVAKALVKDWLEM
jgi:threonyl-tRNA synthetase